MKAVVLFLLLSGWFFQPFSFQAHAQQAPAWAWAQVQEGASHFEVGTPGPIALDANGNLWSIGSFSGQVTLGPFTLTAGAAQNTFDGYVAYISEQGQVIWANAITAQKVRPAALSFDEAGNGYVVGYYTGELSYAGNPVSIDTAGGHFLIKVNSLGNLVWARHIPFDSPTYNGISLAATPAGDVYLGSDFTSPLTIENTTLVTNGYQDVFLVKFNTQGQLQWLRQGGGTLGDLGIALAVAPDGGCYFSGIFGGTAQFSSLTITSQGYHDMFLAHYDPQGDLTWMQTAGGSGTDKPLCLTIAPNGTILVSGYYQGIFQFGTQQLLNRGNDDIFLAAWSATGQPLWATAAGGSSFEYPYAITTDSLSQIYLSFQANALTNFHYQQTPITAVTTDGSYLIKVDQAGALVWSKNIGSGNGQHSAPGLAATPDGRCYVAGSYAGAFSLDNIVLPTTPGGSSFSEFNGYLALLNATVVGLPEENTHAELALHVYPNPASGKVTLRMLESNTADAELQVLDVAGKQLLRKTIVANTQEVSLSLNNLSPGLYFVRLQGPNTSYSAKLILQQ